MLDRAVLACRVHRLEDEQHAPAVLRVELLLFLREPLDAALEQRARLALLLGLEAMSVARIMVPEPELPPLRDPVGTEEIVQKLRVDFDHCALP